jgi:hypothetical protein
MLHKNRYQRAIMLLSIGIMPILAYAGPPYLTDDPNPTDYQHFELYGASILTKSHLATSVNVPSFELDYGLLPNLEIDATINGVANLPPTGARSYGFGDTQISSTYRFIQETAYCPQVAFIPAIFLPTGSADRSLGNGRSMYIAPLWAEKSWGSWTLDTGGGYTFNGAPNMNNYFFGGVLLQDKINTALTLGSEIFEQGAPSNAETSSTILNFGATYMIFTDFSLLFSAGHSIIGENYLFSYLGLSWER